MEDTNEDKQQVCWIVWLSEQEEQIEEEQIEEDQIKEEPTEAVEGQEESIDVEEHDEDIDIEEHDLNNEEDSVRGHNCCLWL